MSSTFAARPTTLAPVAATVRQPGGTYAPAVVYNGRVYVPGLPVCRTPAAAHEAAAPIARGLQAMHPRLADSVVRGWNGA